MMDTLSLLFSLLFLPGVGAVSLLVLAGIWWRERSGQGLVQVIVLGDAGRSPRMQYHCLSLVQLDYNVDLIGYGGSPLIKELRESPRLTHHVLSEPPTALSALPRLLRYVLKVLFQTLNFFWVIFLYTKKPSHILMQTPPSIPTTFVATVACILRGTKLIVDYHNYGHSILALSLGKQHPLVQLSIKHEKVFCGFAYANLCVSDAMKKDLRRTLGISAIILYDRPPGRFQPISVEKRHKLFLKLAEDEPAFRAIAEAAADESLESVTLFSERRVEGKVRLRKDRPFLIVSSTSWTEDEDFGILLKALEVYSENASKDEAHSLPHIMCVITGKGPQKEYYKRIIAMKNFSHVTVCTMWLSTEDYPTILGSADLGVCLHKSSSGLDLPMKVVDMFGCGLPVCAVNYNCLHELLMHQHNGLIFHDHKELAQQLQALSKGFPAKNPQLTRFRENLSSFQSLRWDHYWKLHVLPIFTSSGH